MTEKSNKKSSARKGSAQKTTTKQRLSGKEKALAKTIAEYEAKIEQLQSDLDDQQARVQAAEEKMLRVVAEYENGKKRLEREKARSLTFAKDRVLMGLFPIIDNLERSAKYEDENATEESKQHGVNLVLEQIKKYLMVTDGVESFDPLGKNFDPEFHEAMAMQPAADQDSGIVIEVFEKGYKAGDRVLRAAKVVVSQ
ncbi:MAG: nucleotide exchange factor GrpE [Candidatus Marinimicrobia bacterium]|nr:nucleotide exchange factor GrpE [Candidatus Neomarinimicrobiota bacterium]